MLSDDFENFAGKTQTFQVKQNPSDQQFPVCASSFVLFLFLSLCYCIYCKEIQKDCDIPFMQKIMTRFNIFWFLNFVYFLN